MKKAKKKIRFAVPSGKVYKNEYFQNRPLSFVNVSVTGAACALDCKHCGGSLLRSMAPAPLPAEFPARVRQWRERGCGGFLLSGGADERGRVPLSPYLNGAAAAVKSGMEVVAHTGVIGAADAAALKASGVTRATMDIIGDTDTVRNVCGLPLTAAAYEGVLSACRGAGLAVSPHIVIGLDHGVLKGERKALEAIVAHEPRSVVLVVLKPLKGTAMAGIDPPELKEVLSFLEFAASAAGSVPLALGCACPGGAYRRAVENACLDLGFRAIAYPDPRTVARCEAEGWDYGFEARCCCLTAAGPPPREKEKEGAK
ncbi:MAG: hypothetical protein ACOX8R_05470 [Bacillota bacterium]|jgi:uncharacterized radical SAM superfamily protein